ncbi:MAG: Plug domain-containing protein, partial [Chitinophagaceae bacterium]
EEKLDDTYTSGLFSGGEAITFDVMDDKSAGITANLLSYLTGRVPGMSIINRNDLNGGSSVTWRGASGPSPTFYLNENQIDLSDLSTIDMNNVAYIKIFRPPFIGSFSGGEGGAVAIYLKKGADALQGEKEEKKGMPYKIITGYTAQKEFYSPDYGNLDFYAEKADVRSTLYWNPNIEMTSDNHTQKFTFYNNDISHSYRIVLEGFTKDGKLSHVEKVIE